MPFDYPYIPLGALHSSGMRYTRFRLTLGHVLAGISVVVNILFVVVVCLILFLPPSVEGYVALNGFQHLTGLAPQPDQHAIVTVLYTDGYLTAVLTLGYSLRASNITILGEISQTSLCLAKAIGWTPHPVSYIAPPHKYIEDHFRHQYTKLNIWTLDKLGISSLVYLDADTLVLRNFEELFLLPFTLAAVPDVFKKAGFVIGINANVLFLYPKSTIFDDMISKLSIARYPSTYAEQAFINLYFGAQTTRLPYIYNANLAIKLRSPLLWKAIEEDIRIIHYTTYKPFPSSTTGAHMGGIWKEEVEVWERHFLEMRKDLGKYSTQCSDF
ncbi:glycosyltransferase family 8 protein [Sphaerobolus stellatus SS14]|uniref:Glycosyltransferase family 8 protein n=1 Tax=Sphaerobolus stellatus (strain SS14) TaxID=990650 RepID=A0A0C9TAN0_SPHS4|nr:glycosyltransferase family 8 protein [Sphaerobolus stellatus SS14]